MPDARERPEDERPVHRLGAGVARTRPAGTGRVTGGRRDTGRARYRPVRGFAAGPALPRAPAYTPWFNPPATSPPRPVPLSRRDFVHGSAALAATAALARPADALAPLSALGPGDGYVPLPPGAAPGDPTIRALALRALDAARAAGAGYADVRIGQNRSQAVFTRERRVQGLADSETAGVGVRALVDGTWGFAATRDLTPDGVAGAARLAVAQARVVGAGHLKVTLADGLGGRLDAVAWNAAEGPLAALRPGAGRFHVAGRLEVNAWGGRRGVQLLLDDAARASRGFG